MSFELEAKLSKVRNQKQQNQKQVAVVLSAVEDILREQGTTEFTPTAYFAALLSLLPQSISQTDILDAGLAHSVVYLLDLITPYCPTPLLRSKFIEILVHLAPALTNPEAEAPLLRAAIGCLESLLLAQDGPTWAIPQKDIGPRRALAGLLNLGVDDRPKVRKRAQEAVTKVLKTAPPSPSLDHPAAEMCAIAVLGSVVDLSKRAPGAQYDSRLIHGIQLVHAVAAAGGWPSSKIESLVEILLNISRGNNEFLTMAAFNVFEAIFETVLDEVTSAKLPRIIEAISELRPSQTDSQLLPPWLAIISLGYGVYAAISPSTTLSLLPNLYTQISTFLESPAHNIRTSASQCLISLISNCIPDSLVLSKEDSPELNKIAHATTNLLSVRYQSAWPEVFETIVALFDKLRWKAHPIMGDIVRIIGDLRANEGFQGKKEADVVLGHAITAMGPPAVLSILPLNLSKPKAGQPGRAWFLPILRDYTANTSLAHFLSEMVPLSDFMLQRICEHGDAEKTMEVKIYETIIQQVWSIFPGYCTAPIDLVRAFNKKFAESLASNLYEHTELRVDICKGLQLLVESSQAIIAVDVDDDGKEDLLVQQRITKKEAKKNIALLVSYAQNLLMVLFNIYGQTLPQYRGYILKCINAYLSISPPEELMSTFIKVTTALEENLTQSVALSQTEREKQKGPDRMPPMAHALMDLVITITPYLPAENYIQLLAIFTVVINKKDDPQLQKKAYKVISRMAESDHGKQVLSARIEDLQKVILDCAETATAPARRDRLDAIAQLIDYLPQNDLHFIPSVLSEVVISAKEVNERARTAAFDLLVSMGQKMAAGGTVVNSRIPGMPVEAPNVVASLEEYFTMVSAGLAGSTPHMISASITALTRILFEFKDQLKLELIEEMVTTMDLFLTSKNREIVRSVLGFIKVSIISLPQEMMVKKLETLIPNLMIWSHEHKGHFRAKVKHMLERAIRRFGLDVVGKYVPEEDKKLITNIRKTRERRKRKAVIAEDEKQGEEGSRSKKRQGQFASEFEEAIYGSESEDSDDDQDEEMGGTGTSSNSKRKQKQGKQYIMEDDDEPLDLLDKHALAHISSTKPLKPRNFGSHNKLKSSAKTDPNSGKLVFNEDNTDDDNGGGDDDMILGNDGNEDIGAAVSAYVQAITGKHAVQRGQRNRIKFKRGSGVKEDDDEEEMMDVDQKHSGKIGGKGNINGGKEVHGKRDGQGMRSVKGGRVQKGRSGYGHGYRGRR